MPDNAKYPEIKKQAQEVLSDNPPLITKENKGELTICLLDCNSADGSFDSQPNCHYQYPLTLAGTLDTPMLHVCNPPKTNSPCKYASKATYKIMFTSERFE